MTGKRKLLILSLFLCLSIPLLLNTESRAEGTSGEQTSAVSGLKDENAQRSENVTGMDENGNVYEVDDSNGTLENAGKALYFRSASNEFVVNFNTKGNALTSYTEASTGSAGYTNGAFGADAAYLGMENGQVKFMMSGVVGLVSSNEVQVIKLSEAAVVSGYYVSGGRLIHGIVGNMTTPGYASRLDNGPAPSYLSSGTTYYSYDGHYFYKDYGTMIADYQKNTRSQSVNANNPYYNYFQYLPLRSKSGYSAAEMSTIINSKATSSSSKLKNTGTQFVNRQNTYGVNALAMAGIAANESGWGTSSICQSKNNLFGLNAVDSSPGTSANTYASVDECIRQFANSWMSKGYLYPKDSRYKGGFLGNKGSGLNVKYASDPFWGEKAAAVMWSLDKNGGSKDSGKYTIGIKDTLASSHNTVNVRSANSTSSTALYNTGNSSNYAVLLKESQASNSFYKIQSDGVLNSGRTALNSGSGEYNFDGMYAYVSSDYIVVVNKGSSTAKPKTLESINITTPPSKTMYTEGEKYNAAGMVVKAKWSDGTESDVTKNVTYPTEALSKDMTSVTIQYTTDGVTKTAVQKITVKEKAAVTAVNINPASVELKAGTSRTFGVAVTGTGSPAQTVTWSVEGANNTDTKIDDTGKLQISANETAETLKVKAVSTVDTSKFAEASVKVIKENVSEPEVPDTEKPDTEKPDTEKTEPEKPDSGIQGGGSGEGEPDNNNPQNNGSVDEAKQTTEVKDVQNGIKVSGMLPEDAVLKVDVIEQNAENYAMLTEPVRTNTILGVYDISLDKELEAGESVQLSFKVDSAYNDKNVIVLHYTEVDGNTYCETYKETVKEGIVTIDVSGFSPYIVALDDAGANTINENQTNGPENTLNSDEVIPEGDKEQAGERVDLYSVPNTLLSKSTEGISGVVPYNTGDQAVLGNTGGDKTGGKSDSPDVQVTVPDKDSQIKAVKTGDESKVVVWSLLLVLSVGVVGLSKRIVKVKK